jgi:integrase
LDAVFQFFPAFYVFFLLLLRTNMRSGEALALQPGDINFEGGYIEVRRAIVRGRVKQYPKNGRARRVDMSGQLAEALRVRLTDIKRETLEKGRKTQPVWLFYNEQGNPLDPSNLCDRVFKPALEKAELRKIRIHDFRHSSHPYSSCRASHSAISRSRWATRVSR